MNTSSWSFGFNFPEPCVVDGQTYIAGATAPETNWGDDGVKLRSAAVSLSVS